MKRKVFHATLLALMGMIVLVSVTVAWLVYRTSRQEAIADNKAYAQTLKKQMDAGSDPESILASYIPAGVRVTLIDRDGTVLMDSQANPSTMENHARREEFAEAESTGAGEATRRSETLGEEYLYNALRMTDGRVIRVARSQRTIEGFLFSMAGALLLCVAAAAALSVLIARFAARLLAKPLAQLDLEHPEDNLCYEELTPLLRRIGKQNQEIRARIEVEQRRTREIDVIIEAMREGLVLLDTKLRVLTLNTSARRYLRLRDDAVIGEYLLGLCRCGEMINMINTIQTHDTADALVRMDTTTLEARLSKVGTRGDEPPQGYVLLLSDVTQRQDAERARREFSANVSHEMMTPLTTISGYAEIIENGMAKAEDVKGFAEKIVSESRRMTALVEDIMRLSRLDEGRVQEKWERVDLYALATDVASALSEKAKRLDVQVTVSGQPTCVQAVRQLAWEMLFNLTDNAIKYNRKNGKVELCILPDGFRVTDTGIGIPKEQQKKVFERFYRVDKSHSRKIGGTGLGLSIVRHAAQYLHADVMLDSTENVGTAVTVTFTM